MRRCARHIYRFEWVLECAKLLLSSRRYETFAITSWTFMIDLHPTRGVHFLSVVDMSQCYVHVSYIRRTLSASHVLRSSTSLVHPCSSTLTGKILNPPTLTAGSKRGIPRDVISGCFCCVRADGAAGGEAGRGYSLRERSRRLSKHRAQGQAHDGTGKRCVFNILLALFVSSFVRLFLRGQYTCGAHLNKRHEYHQ